MSDSIKKWHEMQELSDQGGNYIVPKRGGPVLTYKQNNYE